jgi:hypothetical protein
MLDMVDLLLFVSILMSVDRRNLISRHCSNLSNLSRGRTVLAVHHARDAHDGTGNANKIEIERDRDDA